MSKKLSPQGRSGRKFLLHKVEVECAEEGCIRTIFVNRGNAAKPVRCEEHRRIHFNRQQRDRQRRNRKPSDYDPAIDSRLIELRGFRTFVKCRNEFCDTMVEVDGVRARHPFGVYCEECRREAKQIDDRNYYARRGRRIRQKRRGGEEQAA